MLTLLSCFIPSTDSSDEERCQVTACNSREPAALEQEQPGASTHISSIQSQSDLSQRFGQSARGVLVLARPAHLQSPCRRASMDGRQTVAVYCNPAAAALFSCFPVSGPNGDDGREAAECLFGLLQTTEPLLARELLEHLSRATAGDPSGKLTLFLDAHKYPNTVDLKDANGRQCLAIADGIGVNGNGDLRTAGSSGVRGVGGSGRTHKSVTSESAASTVAVKPSSPISGVAAPIRRWLYAIVEPISYDPGTANTGGTSLQVANFSSSNVPFSSVREPVLQWWRARSLQAMASGKDGEAAWWNAIVVTFQAAAGIQSHESDIGRLSGETARGKGAECGGGAGAAAAAIALELCTAPSTTAAVTASTTISTNTPDRPVRCALALASTMSIRTTATADDSSGVQGSGACRTKGASELTNSVVNWSEAQPTWPLLPSMPLAASITSHADGASGSAVAAGGAYCGDGQQDGLRDLDMALRLREQMVLQSLTPMTTAVSVNSGAVLYQNSMSIAYFGQRVRQGVVPTVPTTAAGGPDPARSAIDAAGASERAHSVAQVVPAAETGGGCYTSKARSKLHLLRELFRLEPHKLDRLLLEVCVEGRQWRGIIRVPASCMLPSSPGVLPVPEVAAAQTVATPPSSSTRALVAKACQPGPTAGEVSLGACQRWTFTELNSQRPSASQLASAAPLGYPDTLAVLQQQQQQQQQQRRLKAVRPQAGPSLRFDLSSAPSLPPKVTSPMIAAEVAATVSEPRGTASATLATAAARAAAGIATDLSAGCTSGSLPFSMCANALNNDGDGAPRLSTGAAGLRPSQAAAAATGADPLATSTWGLFMESSDHRGFDSGSVLTSLTTAPAAIDGFYRYPSTHLAAGTASATSCARARAPVVPVPPLRQLQQLHHQCQPQQFQADSPVGQVAPPLPLNRGDLAAVAYTATAAAVPAMDALLVEEVNPLRYYAAPKAPVGSRGAGAAAAAAAGRAAPASRLLCRPRHAPTEDNANLAAASQPVDQRAIASSAAAMPCSVGGMAVLASAEEPVAGQNARCTFDRSRSGRTGLTLAGGDGLIRGSQVRGGLASGTGTGALLVGRTASFTAGSPRVFPTPISSAAAVSNAAAAASPWPRQPVGRVVSRGQVESAGAGGATIARILAFTSSLRSTPTAVQAALQQAVAGSLPLGSGLLSRGDSAVVPQADVSTIGGSTRRTGPSGHAVNADGVPSTSATTSDVACTVRPSAQHGVVASTATADIACVNTPCASSAAVASVAGARSITTTSSRVIRTSSVKAASIGAFNNSRGATVIPASNSMPDLARMARSSADDSTWPATFAVAAAATAADCAPTPAAAYSGDIANRASSAAVVSAAAGSASDALAARNDTLSGWMKSLQPAFIVGPRRRRRCQRQDGAYSATASGSEARRVASDLPARPHTASLDGSAVEPCESNVLALPPQAAAPLVRQPSGRTLASDANKATASSVATAGSGVSVSADSEGVMAMGRGGEHIVSAPAHSCTRIPPATRGGGGHNGSRGVIGGKSGISRHEARVGPSGAVVAAAAAPSAGVKLGTPPPCGADSTGDGGEVGGGDRLPLSLHPGTCWHEVVASPAVDPITGQDVIILSQTDISAKVEAECHIALVSETEHRLLEQIFPRHVLAYMTEEDRPALVAPAGSAPANIAAAGALRPRQPARALSRDINKLATSHSEVTLLFADIQGFTPMCKVLEPRVVMAFLNDLFTMFDRRLDEFGVYKVETIGDCYFVAGGLIHEDEYGMPAVRARDSHADPLHAEKVLMFAKAMLAAAATVTLPTTGGPVKMRIGIHTGPVVSGVVGQRMPRFCLFGDTVNTASRMESTGVPGCIHASEAARCLLRNESWVPTGGIEVKGKGLMNTYLWAPPESDSLRALMLCRGLATSRQTLATSCSGGDGGSESNERLSRFHRPYQPGQQPQRRPQQLGRLRSAAAERGVPASDSGAYVLPNSSSNNEAASSPHYPQQQRRRRSSGAGGDSSGAGPRTCSMHADNWTHLQPSLGDYCSGVEDDSIYSLVTLLLPK